MSTLTYATSIADKKRRAFAPMQQVENRSLVNKCKQSLDWTQDAMLEIKSRNGLAAGRLTG